MSNSIKSSTSSRKIAVRKVEKKVEDKIKSMSTKSGQIRYLHSLGWSQGDIHRYLTKYYGKLVRPQHVSNVLRQPVKDPIDRF